MRIELAEDSPRYDSSKDFCADCHFDIEHCDCDGPRRSGGVPTLGLALIIAGATFAGIVLGFILGRF